MEKREFYDDYAHHPTEIKAVIKVQEKLIRNRKIICIFQPHRYSRVKSLKKNLLYHLHLSNEVVLCPVYSAGEKNKV